MKRWILVVFIVPVLAAVGLIAGLTQKARCNSGAGASRNLSSDAGEAVPHRSEQPRRYSSSAGGFPDQHPRGRQTLRYRVCDVSRRRWPHSY